MVPRSMPTDPGFSALLLHFVVRRKCKRDLCRLVQVKVCALWAELSFIGPHDVCPSAHARTLCMLDTATLADVSTEPSSRRAGLFHQAMLSATASRTQPSWPFWADHEDCWALGTSSARQHRSEPLIIQLHCYIAVIELRCKLQVSK